MLTFSIVLCTLYMYMYTVWRYLCVLNTPAYMYIVCTLSVKNVRDGGLFETDEDDGWEGGAVS